MLPEKMKWYIGCYNDKNSNTMDVKNPGGKTGYGTNNNTIQFCREICANFSYTYLGTQVSLRVSFLAHCKIYYSIKNAV